MKNEGGYTIGIDSNSYKTTLINCTFDYDKLSGTVVIKDSSCESFINKIKHIETDECVAIYDYVGTLSVIPDTPKRKK